MISDEKLINMFNDLDLNDKRNELSSLIIKINNIASEMLKDLNYNEELLNKDVKNYDTDKDQKLTEDEVFTFFYDDLWTIKNKLLLIYSLNKNK